MAIFRNTSAFVLLTIFFMVIANAQSEKIFPAMMKFTLCSLKQIGRCNNTSR